MNLVSGFCVCVCGSEGLVLAVMVDQDSNL